MKTEKQEELDLIKLEVKHLRARVGASDTLDALVEYVNTLLEMKEFAATSFQRSSLVKLRRYALNAQEILNEDV